MTKRNVVVSGSRSALNMTAITAAATVSKSSIFAAAAAAVHKPRPSTTRFITISQKKQLLIKDLEISSWVDSMRASSPTHVHSAASPLPPDVVDDLHSSWLMDHPSALEMFEDIMTATKGKQMAMFLDYDGTLSPIVDDPDRAFMSDATRRAVRKVAIHFPTAIVTGRCRDKVYDFVRLPELYYAGSHGMDIKGPSKGSKYMKGSQTVFFQPAGEFIPMIEEVFKVLQEKTRSILGAYIENNKFCVSVHFRRVDEKHWSDLANMVRLVLKEYPKLQLNQGRKVLEIRPIIKWDKGKALEFLLESLGFADCTEVFPIYIGDDCTDEDAFKVLRDRGQGIGIVVSKVPKPTLASYHLREPSEVMDFLQRLVKWNRFSSGRQLRT